MSKSFRKREQNEHRNQVAQEMIIERIGVNAAGRPMKSRKDKRTKNPKKSWQNEEF